MITIYFSVLFHLAVFLVIKSVESCGPGGAMFISRRLPRKLTPLVLKESWPSLDEFAISAAGPFTTVLTRDHARFKELVPNYNPDIQFSDAEGTGEDHVMTRKCKEKLNMLAISVLNQYPGVKLRVLEAFDLEMVHSQRSLHYEGRAVDVSLSDRDRSKLGMLARLAVEAGFDYVKFSSRTHIHASVKLETGDVHRAGGCFAAKSSVETPEGNRRIDELQIGDQVLVSTANGEVMFSPVILFLDVDKKKRTNVVITTESKAKISLTPSHLLFVSTNNVSDFSKSFVTFAKNVIVGHYLYVKTNNFSSGSNNSIVLEKVVNVSMTFEQKHIAPLTNEGTIIVNNVVASCYAMIENHDLAHAAFAPMRMFLNSKEVAKHFLKTLNFVDLFPKKTTKSEKSMGVHYYALWLYKLGYLLLPEENLYQ